MAAPDYAVPCTAIGPTAKHYTLVELRLLQKPMTPRDTQYDDVTE